MAFGKFFQNILNFIRFILILLQIKRILMSNFFESAAKNKWHRQS